MLGSFLPAVLVKFGVGNFAQMPPTQIMVFCMHINGCCNLLLATTVPRLYPLKLRCSLKHYNFLRLLSSDTLVAKCLSVSFRGVLPS